MTLDLNQCLIINEQLKKENIDEFVRTLLIQYSTDVNHTSYLLSLIPQIAEAQLIITNNKVIDHQQATQLLIGATGKNVDFPTLLFTCKVCFPDGNCKGASEVGKKFFQKFIDAIKEKKGFDWESERDWEWIRDIVQCEHWMKSVLRQNVDEGVTCQTPKMTL